MDPDKCLEELRDRMQKIQGLIDKGGDLNEILSLANEAVDFWNSLDQWLTGGNFLPKEWNRYHRNAIRRAHPILDP